MNYRIAYNFLNVEFRTTDVSGNEKTLADKGFTNLNVKLKKDQVQVENKIWLTYRYNFIVPVTGTEPPLIRVDKWFRNIEPEYSSIPSMGLSDWYPIYVVPEETADVNKLDQLYNTPSNAGCIGLTGLIWTLFKTEDAHRAKYKLLVNNGVFALKPEDLNIKKFKEIFDLMHIENVLEDERNIEVV